MSRLDTRRGCMAYCAYTVVVRRGQGAGAARMAQTLGNRGKVSVGCGGSRQEKRRAA